MRITACRLCGSPRIEEVVDLGFHPLADTFLPEDIQFGPETSYPLRLALCGDCGHVFTLYRVSAEDRYQRQDYSYDSSNSRVSIEHFREFAASVIAARALEPGDLVVDIGSNVGTLLLPFKEAGHEVIGVEPSANISAFAIKAGVPTITDFFCDRVVGPLLDAGPVVALLSANVLNHADDLDALLQTAKRVLAPGGVFVFEVPYLLDLVQRTAFDTIYHEHVHYYGVKPLAAALERGGFRITRLERLEYMCGSIRVYTEVGEGHGEEACAAIAEEDEFGLYDPHTFAAFMDRVREMKRTVNASLARVVESGGRVVGIGAATKGNTFLNYCRLDADTIIHIADSSPLKIGKRTPGSHIPIVREEDLDPNATHALILPWNIADMLKKKLAHLGLEFYVPQVGAPNPSDIQGT